MELLPYLMLSLNITALLGLLCVSKSLVLLVYRIWVSFLRQPRDLKEYGSWAIVTGPTDGIGKAIALRLAHNGLNLVLVGRNPTKLEALAIEIRKKHDYVKLRSVVFDLSSDVDEGIKRLELAIEGLDVGILVNNAASTFKHRFFHEVSKGLLETVITANINGMTSITSAVLPKMVKKKRGAIVNIGSAASLMPSYPLATVYSSTKAYMQQFSRSLYVEYKDYGIDVQCQTPLFLATKMTNLRPSLLVPTPDEYARWCLRFIGYDAQCMPYWAHVVQFWLMRMVPDVLLIPCLFNAFLNKRKMWMLEEKLMINLNDVHHK